MKVLAVLVIVCLVAAKARGHHGGFHRPRPSEQERQCFGLLMPRSETGAIMEYVQTCITENGIDTILEGIRNQRRGRRTSVDQILEENGYTEEALTLRTCVAEAMGFVTEDGTFDGDAFKASLLEKVAGTDLEANVQAGLDTCDTSGFAEFKIKEFLKCVLTSCVNEVSSSEEEDSEEEEGGEMIEEAEEEDEDDS